MTLYGSFLRVFDKILDETVIEVKGSVSETIKRLEKLTGFCRQNDSNQLTLYFYCSHRGNFSVSHPQGRHGDDNAYYVKGKVVSENGKTLVKIYSVKSRETMFWRWLAIALLTIAAAVYLYIRIRLSLPASYRDLIFPAIPLSLLLNFLYYRKEKQSKHEDLEIMKEEALQRVDAVIRWDE